MDCFRGAGGLHRAGGASTPCDELPHGGYVRLTSHYLLQTYGGRIHVRTPTLLGLTPARDACRTVVFFDEAREDARRLDADFAETGCLKGPLHGVPISLKDLCALKFRPRFPVSIPLFSFSLCEQHTQFGDGD